MVDVFMLLFEFVACFHNEVSIVRTGQLTVEVYSNQSGTQIRIVQINVISCVIKLCLIPACHDLSM